MTAAPFRDDGKLPPFDLEAEAAVLSAVLLDPSALPRLADALRPEMFYSEANRRVFEAALDLRAKGEPVDEQTVGSRLRETGRYQQVGGAQYLAEIIQASPAIANVRAHATTVHERWRARQVLRLAQLTVAQGYAGVPDVQAYVDDLTRAAAEISRQQPWRKVETNIETLKRLIRDIRSAGVDAGSSKVRGIPTGIMSLDDLTLGLHAGQKTTVVALPRVGKTVFGLQVAMAAARKGIGAIVFSTEMTRDELAERQLAHLARVDARRLRVARQRETLSPEDWRRLTLALGELQGIKYRLAVHDDTSLTVEDIAARTRSYQDELQAEGVPLGVVVVDYIQRLRPSAKFDSRRNANKYDTISHATEALKNLARELNVALVELAQQKNLSTEKGNRPSPKLGDAAECMQIERSADNVIYLYRRNERDGRTVTASLVKQRAGEGGDVELELEGEYSTFRDTTFDSGERR